jgi:two-component system, OmpR family, KDP operon response regulator KdpE
MEQRLKVLVVDDEPQIRRLIKVSLEGHGYQVIEAADGKAGVDQVLSSKPDIFLLDLGLPDMDGKKVIQLVREWSTIPIIILSARDQETEKVEALDMGANDYITKPFGVGELMARIRVCLRSQGNGADESQVHCGDLVIDLAKHQVTVSGNEVKLTPTQYDLLKVLAQNAGKVLTHRQLLKRVWGAESDDTQYIRVYIGQLRRKIEEDPSRPKYLITESGIGYRLMYQ